MGSLSHAVNGRRRVPSRVVDVEALSAVALSDPDGIPHRLGDFWVERPVIVVFLRHFG